MLRIYRTYYRFLWRYKWRFIAFIVLLCLFTFLETVQPYFYKLFIDALPGMQLPALVRLVGFYFLIKIAAVIVDIFIGFFSDWVIIPAGRDARLEIFKKVQDLDFAYHLNKSTGSLISAFKRGDNAFFDFHHMVNWRLAQSLISFVFLFFFFSSINILVALMLFVSFGLNLLFTRILISYNIKTRKEFNDSEDHVSDIIVDNLINFETVKLFAKEKKEYNRLEHQFVDWYKKLWGYSISFRIIDITIGSVANVFLFLILLVSLNQVVNLDMTIGEYIMVLGFVNAFYPRFYEILYYIRSVAKNQTDMVKYFSILDEQTIVKDPLKPVKKSSVTGEVTFDNVSFSYPDNKRLALDSFSLTIRPGQSVAFVGHSGVGKTTITKLLMRFYDPTVGRILIDGTDIRRFRKSQLRSFMGVVPQEPILFNDTIGYNIGYGSDHPSQNEIVAAAKMANLHDFIDTLPKKYNTKVGERGVKLSGGQKQRLAIARMILSDPDIVIFDEATSQLDSESEKKIQEAFWKAVKDKTTFIIAHRLSTIAQAEKIVVMEHGRIKEIGSHRELLSRSDSLYRHFWQLQSEKQVQI